jgi:hypothetical protein
MKQNKPGYILFLLFSMLAACSALITVYFSQVVIYRQLNKLIITREKAYRLAQSGVSILQAMMTPEKKENEPKTIPQTGAQQVAQMPMASIMSQITDCLNKELEISLTSKVDPIDAQFTLSLQVEQSKLNLNSLYDFEKKKFLNEGTPKDSKKLCIWLFDKIAALTKKPSLFNAFEQHLKNRTFDFNDVTELLSIKEFSDVFGSQIFLTFASKEQPNNSKIFLTDLFTTNTEQEGLNPWFLTQSWCKLLDLHPKQNMSDEEKKKLISKITKTSNWDSDWNNKLKDFYQKEFKDLPAEIKTILTTQFEANIFSLLLKVNMAETNATIFTIVKTKANDRQDHLIGFEIVKNYQI